MDVALSPDVFDNRVLFLDAHNDWSYLFAIGFEDDSFRNDYAFSNKLLSHTLPLIEKLFELFGCSDLVCDRDQLLSITTPEKMAAELHMVKGNLDYGKKYQKTPL